MMPGSKEKGRFGLQGIEWRHIPLASQAVMYTNCHCCATQHYAQPTTIMHPKTADYLMETYPASPGSSSPSYPNSKHNSESLFARAPEPALKKKGKHQ